MNNQRIPLFIGVLIEEEYDRNYMRLMRRNLRDNLNAFEMPDANFKQMFRLNKQSVINLINTLQPHNRNPTSRIPFHLQVLTTLNFVGSGSFQNPIGANCWVSLSQSSVSRIIINICNLITTRLLPELIQFPTTRDNQNKVKQGFYKKWRCRGVIGIIDGTHVEILAPSSTDEEHPPFVYFNRKGKHSVNVMLICDSDTKIIGCSARYPGSVHDSAIWQMSNIKHYLRQNYENGDRLTHLIGDSGYPFEPWLFTLFGNVQDGTPEARFNRQLNSVRNIIERTNGILKNLSRHRVLMYHSITAANIIYTCCVLHNIALFANLVLPENDIEYRDDNDNEENNVADPMLGNNIFVLGRTTRELYIHDNIFK